MKKTTKPATQSKSKSTGDQVTLKMPPGGFNIRQPRVTGAKKRKKPPTPAPTKVAKTKKEWAEIAVLALLLVAIAAIMLPWLWNNQEKKLTTTPPPATTQAEVAKAKAARQTAELQLAETMQKLEKAEALVSKQETCAKAAVAQLAEIKTRLQPLPPVQTVITQWMQLPPVVTKTSPTPAPVVAPAKPLVVTINNRNMIVNTQTVERVGVVINNQNIMGMQGGNPPPPPQPPVALPYWLKPMW